MNPMEENPKTVELRKLLSALKALQSSVERAYHAQMMSDSAVDMMQQTFDSLHAKAKTLLPDDYFVGEALKVQARPDASAQERMIQLQLAVSQLYTYIKEQVGVTVRANILGMNDQDWREVQDMGRTLQEQIITTTRKALKRALSAIEVEMDSVDEALSDEGRATKSKRRVTIEVDSDDHDDKNTPPTVIA